MFLRNEIYCGRETQSSFSDKIFYSGLSFDPDSYPSAAKGLPTALRDL
jgi:hypothetical protein